MKPAALNMTWSLAGVVGAGLFLVGLYVSVVDVLNGFHFTSLIGLGLMLIGWQLGGQLITTKKRIQ